MLQGKKCVEYKYPSLNHGMNIYFWKRFVTKVKLKKLLCTDSWTDISKRNSSDLLRSLKFEGVYY